MDKKLLALALVIVAAAGLSYQIGVSRYQGELKEKAEEISRLERGIHEAREPAASEPTVSTAADALIGDEVNCLACHDSTQTKAFHLPQTIMKIDERSGKRRRVCIDCHGPLGPPWSADEQLTPLSQITFNASTGTLEMDSTVTHNIHKRRLDSGAIRCQSCHGEETKMVIPAPDPAKGQVLLCQDCKYHPEEGNYLTIHLEVAGKKCTTCHTGGVIKVHQNKTKALGQI